MTSILMYYYVLIDNYIILALYFETNTTVKAPSDLPLFIEIYVILLTSLYLNKQYFFG